MRSGIYLAGHNPGTAPTPAPPDRNTGPCPSITTRTSPSPRCCCRAQAARRRDRYLPVRAADDIADEGPASDAERQQQLAAFRAELHRIGAEPGATPAPAIRRWRGSSAAGGHHRAPPAADHAVLRPAVGLRTGHRRHALPGLRLAAGLLHALGQSGRPADAASVPRRQPAEPGTIRRHLHRPATGQFLAGRAPRLAQAPRLPAPGRPAPAWRLRRTWPPPG